ncbi:MAG: MBL fold metallo-hydrolase, partial [Alphaproteobacteria bacterium]|nr:MBL fold metallo-hydrolase [Alphaproteobacteria bacterium]
MRFAIGEAIVDVIIDDDEFSIPLSRFLPGRDPEMLAAQRGTLEPDHVDLAKDLAKFAIQSFVLR